MADIALNSTAPFVRGDVNLDGTVDLADFGILKSNFGRPGTLSKGDVTEDGLVNLSDYGVIKANFGNGATAAPEPTAVVLAGCCALVFVLRAFFCRRAQRA